MPPVFLTAAWRSLVMLNFDVDPSVLEPFVPEGTELDLRDDRALVSLVGFRFLNTRLMGWTVPFHSNFDEVNLRFYVRRETNDGWRRGVVFLKEVVARRAVSFLARHVYNENYITRPVSHEMETPGIGLRGLGRYRWGRGAEELEMTVHVRGTPQLPVAHSEAEFITEHYWAYTRQRDGSTLEYLVEHPQWKVWPTVSAELHGDPAALYGDRFAKALRRPPCSAFLVDGSDVILRRGVRIPPPCQGGVGERMRFDDKLKCELPLGPDRREGSVLMGRRRLSAQKKEPGPTVSERCVETHPFRPLAVPAQERPSTVR